jgi:hypothetical protein|tara:strand:+ start:612 stop:1046 length:435 start_codon:yes stop_codon:yes gene_type:complete
MPNFKLALVEPYLPLKHGILDKENESMYGKYLIIDEIGLDEFYKDLPNISLDIEIMRKMYGKYLEKLKYEMHIKQPHPFIKNYEKIMATPKQFQIQLIEPITVSIGPNETDKYSTAIIKTHLIRLIQRRWRETMKKIIHAKKNV